MTNPNKNNPNSWTRKHSPVTLIVKHSYNIENKKHFNNYPRNGGWRDGKHEIWFGGRINTREFRNIQSIFRNSDGSLREGYSKALVGDGYGAMFFTSNDFSSFATSIIPSSSYLGDRRSNSYAELDFYNSGINIEDNVNAMVIFEYDNYLQIDLGDEYDISGVIIQKRKDTNQYITSCRIQILSGYVVERNGFYREETVHTGEYTVRNYNGPQGSQHKYSIVSFGGASTIYKRGRYVRIYPLDYHNNPSFRAGVLVKKNTYLAKINKVSKANKLLISDTNKFFNNDCSLNGEGAVINIGGNTNIKNLYDNKEKAKDIFRIDLGKNYRIFSIITKGCDAGVLNSDERANNFLIYYKVAYSVDNNNWYYVRYGGRDQIFLAGKQNSPFEAKLRNPVNARYISIVPMIWYSGNNKLPLRFGVVVESNSNATQFNFNHENIEDDLQNYNENLSAFIIPRKISKITDQIITGTVENLSSNNLYSNNDNYALCRCIATNTYHKVKNYKHFKNNYGCHGYGHLVNIENPDENIPFVKNKGGPLDYIVSNLSQTWNNLISVFNSKNKSNRNINSNVLNAVVCPNIDKSLTPVSSEFNSEKISSNFSIPIGELTQISLIFNKTDNGINVKCIKNNDHRNEISLEGLTQEELFGNSDYKLFIGRLLDHTSNINIKDFRIYKNIDMDNYNNLIGRILTSQGDKHKLIVEELINRERVLFNRFSQDNDRNTYMNDMDRLFSFKIKHYETNNNQSNIFNRKMCIRKKNKTGFTSLNVNNEDITGVEYNYNIQRRSSNDPTFVYEIQP